MAGSFRQRGARALKIALPLSAFALILFVLLFPRDEFGEGISIEGVTLDGDGLRLEQPRITGAARDGRPFVVTADWALPDGPNPETVELGPLRGETMMGETRRLTLEAGGGRFRVDSETLTLTGAVALVTSDGWRLTASAADVDLDDERLSAQGPVSGSGPSGDLEAGSMRAERREDGDYLWFEGGVRLRITPNAADGGGNG